jgi:small subunit ribosomal protein S1
LINEENIQQTEETPVVSAPETAKKANAQVESAHDDFDWDADEAGFQTYSAKDREVLESAYTNTFNPITEKQVVHGKVVAINDKDVVVSKATAWCLAKNSATCLSWQWETMLKCLLTLQKTAWVS